MRRTLFFSSGTTYQLSQLHTIKKTRIKNYAGIIQCINFLKNHISERVSFGIQRVPHIDAGRGTGEARRSDSLVVCMLGPNAN